MSETPATRTPRPIQLAPDVETALVEAARRRGVTPDALADECLRERFMPRPTGTAASVGDHVSGGPRNLLEFLGDSVGAVGGEDPNAPMTNGAEDTGRKFTEILLRRRADGRL
jgi:hypothetical protein